jgi:hypothetical protein
MTRQVRLGVAALCAAVATLGGIAAGLGVFARGDGIYETVTSARGELYEVATTGVYAGNARQLVAEGVGWDVFTLIVAVPILLIAAVLLARGSFRGTLIAGGMLGYFVYMHLEYAVTWAFGPMFGLFIATYGLSIVGLIGIATLVADAGVEGRFSDAFPRRSWAALSVGMAILLTILWVGRIAEGLAAEIPILHGETTMTVQALDLGLVVPVSLVLGVVVLRRIPAVMAASVAFAVTFVTMSAAIGSMMVSSWIVTGEPAVAPIVVFGAAAIAGLLVTVRMFGAVQMVPSHRTPALVSDVGAASSPASHSRAGIA